MMQFYLRNFSILCTLLFSILFTSSQLQAQKGNSISEFMDDGGINAQKQYITVDLMSALLGDCGIIYGHKMVENFYLEGGAGVILPYYIGSLYDAISDENRPDNKYGFSLLARPKYYVGSSDEPLSNVSLGVLLRLRHWNNDTRFAYGITFEKQWVWWNTIVPGFGMDLGLYYKKAPQNDIDPSGILLGGNNYALFNAYVKIGVVF